ncbi:PRTRC system protein E [Mucilaginibacter sp. PAMB04274]|uniref:PRTRC system protein E n=1 Tax=Mucilaginibacter sp. PAMB04274 TaxID=3138568 RepID=UPI0031F64A37
MTTNFFQNIIALQVPGKWNRSIHSDEQGHLTISALFTAGHQADNATKAIPPMLLRGTAEELDNGFFEAIMQPVEQTAGLYHNLNAYAKELEKAKLASKMEQDKKAKAAKAKTEPKESEEEDGIEVSEPKPDKEAQRRAWEEAMQQVSALDSQCLYEEALAVLPSVTDYPDKATELAKKQADLERRREQKKALLF